jgi:site-specific DNA recombinase
VGVLNTKRDVDAGRSVDQPPVSDSYVRLSRVPETGEPEQLDVQWADNRKVVDRVGALGEKLQGGLSAWKRGVRRPGWERVESGESDGIVVWHTDRLFRQPRDLETDRTLGNAGSRTAQTTCQPDA